MECWKLPYFVCGASSGAGLCAVRHGWRATAVQLRPLPVLLWLWLVLFTLVVVRTLATAIWMLALPYLGLTSITYTSMLIGLGLLSLGLARWDALV